MGIAYRTSWIIGIVLAVAIAAWGDPPPDQPKHNPEPADRSSSIDAQVSLDGKPLKYKATAGQLLIKDDSGKPKAEMFFVAYEKQPADEPGARPILFIFNGGPGASAAWLHLGAAGPKRIALDEQGHAPAPPYRLVDNPATWLGAADLVFIDPVGTGFSRAVSGEKPEQFYGVQEDIQSVGDFIRLYLTRNLRWTSPKFLAGESYGTTRAAGLSEHLLDDGVSINGIILISSVLNFRTLQFNGGNELPYAVYLPSYNAIARHFEKLPSDLQSADADKVRAEVEAWAMHDYLAALVAGNALPPEKFKQTAERLARYTGISRERIEQARLRIDPGEFRRLLLADQRQIIGRFDARIAAYNPDPLSNSEPDPSLPGYLAAYTACANDYLRNTLKFESDHSYDVLTGRVQPWNFGPAGNGFLDVSPQLQEAMIKNPRMKVMFCNGTADLATPYLAATYTINHLELSDALRSNVTHHLYAGGHMMYHVDESLKKLGSDVRAFIGEASPSLADFPATQSSAPAQ